MKKKSINILTSLDELKDTRLSVLGSMNKEALAFILKDPEPYLNRYKDDWDTLTEGLIDIDDFNDRYQERNFAHLCAAPPTNFYFDLANILRNAVSDIFDDKVVEEAVELVVNLYPYKCNRSEIITLRNVLQMEYAFTNEFFNIRFIYKRPEEITINFIKSEVDSYYLYSINDWLTSQKITNIETVNLPEKSFVAAKLLQMGFWNVNLDEKVTFNLTDADMSVTLPAEKVAKMATEAHMGLDLIHASYYSLVNSKILNNLQYR